MKRDHRLALLVGMRTTVLLAGVACCGWSGAVENGSLRFKPYQFENSRGERIPAELAYLSVPENRNRTGSRMIRLAVLRFRSTAARPGDPIIYLAGGPGASAIEHARGVRFPAFMALRRAGDVIALEQRGTGLSSPNLACPERVGFPNDFPLTREQVASRFRVAAASCAAYWRRRGADLAGYNILESADDIEALRQALGARQVVLWGVSYGSQLGLVTLRRHPTLASRAILAGVIGPDDTWPLPSAIDLRFDTISGLGLTSEFRSVLAKLDSHPVVVRLPGPGSLGGRREGDGVSLTIGGYDFLSFVSGALGDPLRRATVPALLSAAAQGELGAAAPFILRDHAARSIGSAMAYATSCASGSSAMRRQRITREASQSVLAPTPNLVEASCDVWGVADLGEGFRQPVRSDVPTLLISGTLDETTPMENAVAVLQGLSRGQHLILVGARHGNPLVVGSPMIVERMLDFLAGRPLGDLRIQVPSSLTP